MTETIPEAVQLPIYATVESLENVWREMDGDDELATANARIQAAHTVVRAELATAGMPTLEVLVAAGRLEPAGNPGAPATWRIAPLDADDTERVRLLATSSALAELGLGGEAAEAVAKAFAAAA